MLHYARFVVDNRAAIGSGAIGIGYGDNDAIAAAYKANVIRCDAVIGKAEVSAYRAVDGEGNLSAARDIGRIGADVGQSAGYGVRIACGVGDLYCRRILYDYGAAGFANDNRAAVAGCAVGVGGCNYYRVATIYEIDIIGAKVCAAKIEVVVTNAIYREGNLAAARDIRDSSEYVCRILLYGGRRR